MSAIDKLHWRKMQDAPKDGSRIIVVIRASEQGPADVDIVVWAQPERAAEECWMSTDSSGGCAIVYEDWELAYWMPQTSSMPEVKTPDLAGQLPKFPRQGNEIGGSGI